jgi:hypothetical protein
MVTPSFLGARRSSKPVDDHEVELSWAFPRLPALVAVVLQLAVDVLDVGRRDRASLPVPGLVVLPGNRTGHPCALPERAVSVALPEHLNALSNRIDPHGAFLVHGVQRDWRMKGQGELLFRRQAHQHLSALHRHSKNVPVRYWLAAESPARDTVTLIQVTTLNT